MSHTSQPPVLVLGSSPGSGGADLDSLHARPPPWLQLVMTRPPRPHCQTREWHLKRGPRANISMACHLNSGMSPRQQPDHEHTQSHCHILLHAQVLDISAQWVPGPVSIPVLKQKRSPPSVESRTPSRETVQLCRQTEWGQEGMRVLDGPHIAHNVLLSLEPRLEGWLHVSPNSWVQGLWRHHCLAVVFPVSTRATSTLEGLRNYSRTGRGKGR